jgi:tRNA threonylcarbamoyladenosine biosynthesis protein TsaE
MTKPLMKRITDSVASMHQLGNQIGQQLKSGDLVVLTGELGAGKTVLTQGIATALGVENVTSPTFVISRIHKGKPNFIHIDAYRLLDSGVEAFADLDFESYLPNSVFVIEWGKDFISALSDQYLDIKISITENEEEREIEITGFGQRWQDFKL